MTSIVSQIPTAKMCSRGLSTEALAAHYFRQLGVVVDSCKDGQEAIEILAANTYDLVLMDLILPVMDGFTAVAKLREHGYSGVIVAATGLTQPADRQRCMAVGCDAYLRKPYSRSDLATLLDSVSRGEVATAR